MSRLWNNFQGSSAEVFSAFVTGLPGSPKVQLVVFSALLGIILIFLYRFVSFQNKLKLLKEKIGTAALEPYIFRDSIRISLTSPLRLTVLALQYLALSIPPLLILAIPVVWILGLWNQVIGYVAPILSDQMAVTISAEAPKDIRQLRVSLDGNGYEISPLVRSYRDSMAWLGLKRVSDAPTSLIVEASGAKVALPLLGNPILPVLSLDAVTRLLFPGARLEMPNGLSEISVNYPSRYFEILGIQIPWTVLFLLISMASGLIFAKIFRIQV